MSKLPSPCRHHVRRICKLLKLRLQHVTCADFLLLILPYRQRRNQLLASPAVDEEEVFLADLHTKLLLRIVELAHASSFRECAERELTWMRAREFDDLEPGDVVGGIVRIARSALVM